MSDTGDTETTSSEPLEAFLVRSARLECLYLIRAWILTILGFIAVATLVWWLWPTSHRVRTVQAKYVWVQMLPDEAGLVGGRLVRAIITEGDRCPTIMQDRKPVEMDIRTAPVRNAFPIILCQARIPEASDAWIGTRRLPVRASDPQDFVLIGDTGCRVVYYDTTPQHCMSGTEWPFASVARHAAAIAADAPSVVVHVGDFNYRENPCADGSSACGGSPYGDNWATWEEEFFKPAQPLLLAAPWIIMRGNHENCARAGAGWLYFFAQPDQKYADACANDLEPYSVRLGTAKDGRPRVLIVLDTADDRTSYGLAKRCGTYQKWVDKIDWPKAEVWLALHQPLWLRDPGRVQKEDKASTDPCGDAKTESALDGVRARFEVLASRPSARLVLSGDIHLFELFQPRDRMRPIQLVVGNGGTKLDALEPRSGLGAPIAGSKGDDMKSEMNRPLKSYGVEGIASAVAQFGFARLRLDQSNWTVDLYDSVGNVLASCPLTEPDGPTLPDDKDLRCTGPLAANESSDASSSRF
jgi:hypothetical protein